MSVDLMRLCWDIEFPSAAMSAVAVKLADHANDEGDNVYPSVPSIERKTRLGTSTVRRTLAAFEECGLLEVVTEAHGNKALKSTTVRRFNVGFLHALACVVVRSGKDGKAVKQYRSTHVLKEIADEAGKLRWVIVARGPDDPSDYPAPEETTTAPLPQREGCDGSTPPTVGGATDDHPSHSGRGPLPQRDPTPPTVGPKPSINHQRTSPPLPPAGGGRGRAKRRNEIEVAIAAVREDVPGDADRLGVIDDLIAPLVRQRRFDAPSPEEALRALANGIARHGLSATERSAIVAKLLAARKVTVKPADIEDAVKVAVAHRPQAPQVRGDAALSARWPEVETALAARLGRDVTAAWFSTLVIVRRQGGTVVLATHLPFIERYIEQTYSAELRTALDAVLGGVSAYLIEVKRPGRAAA